MGTHISTIPTLSAIFILDKVVGDRSLSEVNYVQLPCDKSDNKDKKRD
ncbi:hypothetical protein [Myxosarcina sp. GI1]|nr:hypothetical protein [Myxosarcina sp. GI1]